MNKILFISYSWNLAERAGGIQSKRLCSGLKKYFDVQVLCREFNVKTEESLGCNILKIRSLNLFFLDRLFLFVFRFLREVFSIDQYLWCYTAYRKIKKENINFDYILTVHAPFPVRFLGFLLKKKYSKPLITFLFDPYSDNIYFRTDRFSVFLRRKIEKKIVLKSDYLIFNNDIVYDIFCERYASKIDCFFILPLCCDYNSWLELLSNDTLNDSQNNKRTFLHAGVIHGKRNLKGLNQIILYMKELDPNLSETFQVVLYGKLRQSDIDEVLRCKNEDVILIKEFLSPERLFEEMKKADALVVIDAMGEDNICFPSKICDYFLFNKPIIGITPQRSVTRNILTESGHICCDESEYKQIASVIYESFINRSNKGWMFDKNYYKRFLPENIAESLLSIISR